MKITAITCQAASTASKRDLNKRMDPNAKDQHKTKEEN